MIGVGFLAGTINTIVGSGSLITFPTLLAFGFPPVIANVSNNVGMVPGNVSGGFGYRRELAGPLLSAGVCLSGVYGGYFGAAQGVLVIGLLGSFLDETLQRVTGAKNVLVAMVNGTAAVVFIALAHVSWTAVALLAAGSTAGGLLGARYGRRLPPAALRLFVVAIGVISAAKLIFF